MFGNVADPQDQLEPGEKRQKLKDKHIPALSENAHCQYNAKKDRQGSEEIRGFEYLNKILVRRIDRIMIPCHPDRHRDLPDQLFDPRLPGDIADEFPDQRWARGGNFSGRTRSGSLSVCVNR